MEYGRRTVVDLYDSRSHGSKGEDAFLKPRSFFAPVTKECSFSYKIEGAFGNSIASGFVSRARRKESIDRAMRSIRNDLDFPLKGLREVLFYEDQGWSFVFSCPAASPTGPVQMRFHTNPQVAEDDRIFWQNKVYYGTCNVIHDYGPWGEGEEEGEGREEEGGGREGNSREESDSSRNSGKESNDDDDERYHGVERADRFLVKTFFAVSFGRSHCYDDPGTYVDGGKPGGRIRKRKIDFDALPFSRDEKKRCLESISWLTDPSIA